MLVKDIYGGSYGCLGLTGDLIASSFGKSATADKGESWTYLANLYLAFCECTVLCKGLESLVICGKINDKNRKLGGLIYLHTYTVIHSISNNSFDSFDELEYQHLYFSTQPEVSQTSFVVLSLSSPQDY